MEAILLVQIRYRGKPVFVTDSDSKLVRQVTQEAVEVG